jgi:hypothetical protein
LQTQKHLILYVTVAIHQRAFCYGCCVILARSFSFSDVFTSLLELMELDVPLDAQTQKHWRSCERRVADALRVLQHGALRGERDLVHAIIYRNANQHHKHAYFQGLRSAVRALDRLDAAFAAQKGSFARGTLQLDESNWLAALAQLDQVLVQHLYSRQEVQKRPAQVTHPHGTNASSAPALQLSLETIANALEPLLEVAVEWLAVVRHRLRISFKHAWHHLVLRANFLALGMALVAAAGRLHAIVERAMESLTHARRHLHWIRKTRQKHARHASTREKRPQQHPSRSAQKADQLREPVSSGRQQRHAGITRSTGVIVTGSIEAHARMRSTNDEPLHAAPSLYHALEATRSRTSEWSAAPNVFSTSPPDRAAPQRTREEEPAETMPRSHSVDSLDEIFAAAEASEADRLEHLRRYID